MFRYHVYICGLISAIFRSDEVLMLPFQAVAYLRLWRLIEGFEPWIIGVKGKHTDHCATTMERFKGKEKLLSNKSEHKVRPKVLTFHEMQLKIHSHDVYLTHAAEVCGAKNRKFSISAATQRSVAHARIKRTPCEWAFNKWPDSRFRYQSDEWFACIS